MSQATTFFNRGDYSKEVCCMKCSKIYSGDHRNITSLLRLHMKKSHSEPPRPNIDIVIEDFINEMDNEMYDAMFS